MDPPHITEFASERYFSKLTQLSEPHSPEGPSQAFNQGPLSATGTQTLRQPSPSPPTLLPTQQATFILPLRTPVRGVEGSHETTRTDKGRLRSLRSKVSFLHSKSSTAETRDRLKEPASYTAATKGYASFDRLFLALPNELQIQIITSLSLSDVLHLRMVSRTWHALVSLNESPIVRYHLDHHIPAYALRLYPVMDPAMVTFHHLCGLWHRLHVATKLSFLMCEWITKDIFLRTTPAQRQEFSPQSERMRRRLIPLLFTIFHFFESYRRLHLQYILDHDGHGLSHEPYTLNPIELKIMSYYDDQTLLRVHQVFPLVISSFCRQLRPPSYVGRVERSLRGYLREKPPDEVHSAILCLGGLRQVERFWEIKGYNSRRGAVDAWFNDIKEPPPDVLTKPRRGLMGFGRKMSTVAARDTAKSNSGGRMSRRGSDDSLEDAPLAELDGNLVFNTSLAAGMPMNMLDRDHLRSMLSDLPVLQQIWSTTAEALILDRRIVKRPQDIKRNAQVMLDLIKDDGIQEEDEWLYGKGTPESVRPPLEAINEDPMDCS